MIAAEVTWFYRWGPRDTEGLTWSEIEWWAAQAIRIGEAHRVK